MTLSSFFAGNAKRTENTFFAASPRFVNAETGEPEQWEIKAITSAENNAIRKACMKVVPAPGGRKGQTTQEFDASAYQAKVAAACTVWPDLANGELQNSYGAFTPEAVLCAMLLPGEFEDYSAAVLEHNGFLTADELVDEAKN